MGGFRMIGIVPLGIGLTVLWSLWFGDFGPLGGPPLFFRLFGSFVALGFVMTGATFLFGRMIDPSASLLEAMRELERHRSESSSAAAGTPGTAFSCPNCGSSLGDEVDVSPNGDVKCEHCRRWFNIHRRG